MASMKQRGPLRGRLLLIGGNETSPEIIDAAVRLGQDAHGQARWVFVDTAMPDHQRPTNLPPELHAVQRSGGSVARLHTRDRNEADTEAFVAPLRSATAVFFGGGRQFRLVDVYAGTLAEREFRAVLDRGGLIAGSSAGATIQGSYLVRGDPSDDNTKMMVAGYERGFGYVRNAAIDQHVAERGREAHLVDVVRKHPNLIGIGIDEDTAAIIEGDVLTVIGRGRVLITDGAGHDGVPYQIVRRGMRYDLAGLSTD